MVVLAKFKVTAWYSQCGSGLSCGLQAGQTGSDKQGEGFTVFGRVHYRVAIKADCTAD